MSMSPHWTKTLPTQEWKDAVTDRIAWPPSFTYCDWPHDSEERVMAIARCASCGRFVCDEHYVESVRKKRLETHCFPKCFAGELSSGRAGE